MNIDYLLMDALGNSDLDQILFTYDIWCKYHINLESRAKASFPPHVVSNFLRMQRRGFVPKLHLYAHGAACRTIWSLNFHRGVGRLDGKSTERDWAAAVLAAMQTAEMNPGNRHAVLDDHWIDKNFRRVVGLSKLPCYSSCREADRS